MITIKNSIEIAKMRESNRIVALVLDELVEFIKPGITTNDINNKADSIIRGEGATPSFKGYSIPGLKPFPGSVCVSLNSMIVHGIPQKNRKIKQGDIVGVDVGAYKDGYHGDSAYTYVVGEISDETNKLLKVTKEALNLGISKAIANNRVGDISSAIYKHVKKHGYFVADSLTGHGIGRKLHEDPSVPNFGKKGRGPRLKQGMTIAIEPMVNIGTNEVKEDGWEYTTADNSLSAHFEHTILITDGEPEILSTRGKDVR
ncbi:MAG: type I methionyl aminopeptidase [Candidatus Cloacimonadota bacterium]|nr:type I methionyl aminopeptidase [Candidatus Cloacimonadota bacterium]